MVNPQKKSEAASEWHKNFLKITRATFFSLASLTLLSVPIAEASTIQTFSIVFAGDRTGSGTFSVDVGGSICVDTIYAGCTPGFYPGYPLTSIFYNPVTSFSVDIAEQHYGYMDIAWWLSGLQQPGRAYYPRGESVYTVEYNAWYASYLSGALQLRINFLGSDPNSGYGTWDEAVIPGLDPNGLGYYASGTWTATANSSLVPLPASVYLFVSGVFGILGLARRKG